MTKKPFRTFFRPISMNVHQQFFMEILARHQWEALYLWPFTDLVYLLEEEQENIDPENFVKELVVTNPIILNTLRTTIKQETKKQFNKSISHSYTNKIFPLATKTELRQGGRKQSVQTLIKLIHSVEKYYDEHNGQRKETRANTIKEDPKKWTWQLYQELNQALRHPSAVHQKLFYQNYSTLENRSMTKKQSKNFHVDQYDVIKQLEILLLPAIEKTRQAQGAAQLKRSSKLKGNLQGNFKPSHQMAQASIQQIRNLLLRTSHLRRDSLEKHRVMRSKLIHSRMIQTLLSSPKNQQHLLREKALNPSYKWDDAKALRTFEKELVLHGERDRVNETIHTFDQISKLTLKRSHLKNLTYKNSLQKESHEDKTTIASSRAFIKMENRLQTILERVSLRTLPFDRTKQPLRAEKALSTKGIQTQREVLNQEGVEKIRDLELFGKYTLKRGYVQNLVYRENLDKLPVAENRLKNILDRVSLNTLSMDRTESHLRNEKAVLTKVIKTQREALNQKTLEHLRTIETLNPYTLKRSPMQNLVYRATLDKESLQKEHLQQERRQLEVSTDQRSVHLDKLPVAENRLKTILERVSLTTLSMDRTESHLRTEKAVLTKAIKTQREALNQKTLEHLRTIETLNPYTLKRSPMQNLVYRATLDKESLQKGHLQKESLQQERRQLEVSTDQLTVHLEKLPVLENRLKTILERVNLSTLSINRPKSILSTEKAFSTKGIQTQREVLNQEVIERHKTLEPLNPYTLKRSPVQNLVYRETLDKERLQKELLQKEHLQQERRQLEVLTDQPTVHLEKLPVLENRLKTILERVNLSTLSINRTKSILSTEKAVSTKGIQTQREVLNQEVIERLKTLEPLNPYTLKRSPVQNLVYRETLDKERLQKELLQKEHLQQERRQLEVLTDQPTVHLEKLPVLENRLKTILERVNLSTLSINRTKSILSTEKAVSTKGIQTQREVLNQEVIERLKTLEPLNPYTLKRSRMQNLVYREDLKKEILRKENLQQENLQQVRRQLEVSTNPLTAHLEKLPVMENRLKTILERVSLHTLSNKKVETSLSTLKRSHMQNLVYSDEKSQLTSQLRTSENQKLKERYYQTLTETILLLTDRQLSKKPLQTERYTKIVKTSMLKGVDLNKILIQRKLLIDKVSLKSPSIDHPNSEMALSEKAIEEIEVLKEKLAIAKDHERAELEHENRLITTSRNLITKNRQESEIRHNMKKSRQPKKLSTKNLNIQQHDIPPLVQAPSKLVSKTWIQEMVKVSSQEAQSSLMERNLLTNKNTLTESASAFSTDSNREGRMADKDNAFEIDPEKIDLIVDQVFRRVTDKIERERKRRGL